MYDLLKGNPEFLKYKIFFAAEINIYMGFPPNPARQLEPVWLPVKYLPLTRQQGGQDLAENRSG
jgi:hypothetical protein